MLSRGCLPTGLSIREKDGRSSYPYPRLPPPSPDPISSPLQSSHTLSLLPSSPLHQPTFPATPPLVVDKRARMDLCCRCWCCRWKGKREAAEAAARAGAV